VLTNFGISSLNVTKHLWVDNEHISVYMHVTVCLGVTLQDYLERRWCEAYCLRRPYSLINTCTSWPHSLLSGSVFPLWVKHINVCKYMTYKLTAWHFLLQVVVPIWGKWGHYNH